MAVVVDLVEHPNRRIVYLYVHGDGRQLILPSAVQRLLRLLDPRTGRCTKPTRPTYRIAAVVPPARRDHPPFTPRKPVPDNNNQ